MSAAAARKQKAPLSPNESRRGFIRVDFDAGSKVTVVSAAAGSAGTAGAETNYEALDLSVYGLSFLAEPAHSTRFPMGGVLRLSFWVIGREITVEGRVAYLRTDPTAAGALRVAVEFTQIGIDDVWFLSRYVAEKSGVNRPKQIGSGAIDLSGRIKAKAKAKKKAAGTKKKPLAKKRPAAKKSRAKKRPAKRR